LAASSPFLLAFGLYKITQPLRVLFSLSVTPIFTGMTRENSVIAGYLGEYSFLHLHKGEIQEKEKKIIEMKGRK